MLWAVKNKERVVVSTGTINLQQQLYEKDCFSGNLRLNVLSLIDLPTARCRYGKHLLVQVGPLADNEPGPNFDRLFADHPPLQETTDTGEVLTRGLPVRLRVRLHNSHAANSNSDESNIPTSPNGKAPRTIVQNTLCD